MRSVRPGISAGREISVIRRDSSVVLFIGQATAQFRKRYVQKPKWYKVRFKNPGNDVFAYWIMLRKLFILWIRHSFFDRVSSRKLVKILSYLTAVNMIMGLISLTIGASHISGTQSDLDPNPYNPIAKSHYIGITIMGSFMCAFSLLGLVGIYGKELKFTTAFSIVSFVFGYLLTALYISWLTQIYLSVRETGSNSGGYDTFIYNLTYFFMNLILVSSFLQTSSGLLSLWLLVLHKIKQGYVPMYYRADVDGVSRFHYII